MTEQRIPVRMSELVGVDERLRATPQDAHENLHAT